MMRSALRNLVRRGRNYDLTWRYLFNFAPSLAYQMKRPGLSGEAQRVLTELNRDGIAVTSAQALFGEEPAFRELYQAFEGLQDSLGEQLSKARGNGGEGQPAGEKSFIFEYLGQRPVLEPEAVYARFALHQRILQIANAYLGMYTRMRYYNIWHTFTSQAEARQSQLWHRDREDRYILKAFVYLSDVVEGAGPFTYAAGSHAKGGLRQQPEYFVEGGVKRSTDAQMAKVVAPDRWIRGTGPKGTIIFADTQGYHKGGLARERDRIMYTCMFTSPASESQEFLQRSQHIPYPKDKALAFALAAPKGGAWLSWHPGGFCAP
jgi:hypothetical protein